MSVDPVWRWREQHPKLFEIAISVFIGLVVEIVLVVAEPPALSIVRKSADEAADTMIRLSDRLGRAASRSPGYAFIDIDDATWNAWGRHVVTPRDRIARLIERAAAGKPLAIVLDVDLSFRDEPQNETALIDVLKAYPATAPALVLVRSLDHAGAANAPPVQRPTVFDPAAKDKSNIIFAAPLFERDRDGQVRRWRLFAQTCLDDRPAVLPASQVATAVLARQAIAKGISSFAPAPVWDDLRNNLAAFSPDNCVSGRQIERGTIAKKIGDAGPIEIERTDASTRVLYRIGWRSDTPALGSRLDAENHVATLVSVRPAQLVEAAPTEASTWLGGRIAIVGGSFVDSGDWYQTPLGRMPGALVLVNAIEALTVHGTPTEPDLQMRTLISFAIIIVAAVAAAYLRPLVAGLATAAFVLLVMMIFLRKFQSGVVIDLAIPAVGAAIHDLGASMIRSIQEFRKEGVRWVLKKPEHKEAPAAPDKSEGSDVPAALSVQPPPAKEHSA